MRRSVKSFEAAEQRRVNGRALRAEQRMVRARATAAADDEEPSDTPKTEKAYIGGSNGRQAPSPAPGGDHRGRQRDRHQAAAKYGGGYTRWNDTGDIYLARQPAFRTPPLLGRNTLTGFMSYGERGRGPGSRSAGTRATPT